MFVYGFGLFWKNVGVLGGVTLTIVSLALVLSLYNYSFFGASVTRLFSPPLLANSFGCVTGMVRGATNANCALGCPMENRRHSTIMRCSVSNSGGGRTFTFCDGARNSMAAVAMRLVESGGNR